MFILITTVLDRKCSNTLEGERCYVCVNRILLEYNFHGSISIFDFDAVDCQIFVFLKGG